MFDFDNPAPNLFRADQGATTSFEQYYRELVEGKREGAANQLLLGFLGFLSIPYSAALRLRALGYKSGLIASHRLSKPVVSVGNITLGGTGKTPMVAWICRYMMERGKKVAVLSRGYGGSSEGAVRIVADGSKILLTPEEAGDEPYLLATMLPGLQVVIGADRYRAGLMAEERLVPDIFILDDGFQHQRLDRDLNILLLDCTSPFHNGRTLPAGFLREPASALKRADLLIYTRCGGRRPEGIPGKPFCAADHRLTGITTVPDGKRHPFDLLKGRRGMAFAGIANAAGFFDSLERAGLKVVTTLTFPDHSPYGDEEIAAICRLKAASRSEYLITTEKDSVKLLSYWQRLGEIHAAELAISFHDSTLLTNALNKLL